MPSHARPWNVVRLVQETARPFHALAKQKGLDFELRLPEEHVVATRSRTLLERILQQLLGNAVRFSRSGRIRVWLLADEEEIAMGGEDTGIGISPEFLPYAFDAFAQESSGRTRTHEGAGLGLTVAGRMAGL